MQSASILRRALVSVALLSPLIAAISGMVLGEVHGPSGVTEARKAVAKPSNVLAVGRHGDQAIKSQLNLKVDGNHILKTISADEDFVPIVPARPTRKLAHFICNPEWIEGLERRQIDNAVSLYFQKIAFSRSDEVRIYAVSSKADQRVLGVEIFDAVSGKTAKKISFADTVVRAGSCVSSQGAEGCKFPVVGRFAPGDLKYGVYFARLFGKSGYISRQAYFLLRPEPEDVPENAVGLLSPTFTWQAYNRVANLSFYTREPSRNYRISLRRPLNTRLAGAHNGRSTVAFARKLEEMGLAPIHLSSMDLHRKHAYARRLRLLIIPGHDEYWTDDIRRFVEEFLEAGGQVAIFSGNVSFFKIVLKDGQLWVSKKGREPTHEVYRQTGRWSRPWIKRPIQQLLGLTYDFGGYPLHRILSEEQLRKSSGGRISYLQSHKMRVVAPKHPIFRHTGLGKDDLIGGEIPLISIEVDAAPLKSDGSLDMALLGKVDGKLRNLAWGYAIKHKKAEIKKRAMIAELTRKNGARLIHFGSIGWFASVDADVPDVTQIFANTVNYLLGRPLAPYQAPVAEEPPGDGDWQRFITMPNQHARSYSHYVSRLIRASSRDDYKAKAILALLKRDARGIMKDIDGARRLAKEVVGAANDDGSRIPPKIVDRMRYCILDELPIADARQQFRSILQQAAKRSQIAQISMAVEMAGSPDGASRKEAQRILEDLANAGNISAEIQLARLLDKEGDEETALKIYRRLAKAKNAHAQSLLLRRGMVQPGLMDDETRFRYINELLNFKYAELYLMLGVAYELGKGTKANLRQAWFYYLRAAQGGNALAQERVANMFATGHGVGKSLPKAKQWYTRAAQNKSVTARANLDLIAKAI